MAFWTCSLKGRSQCSWIFSDTAPFLCLFPVPYSSVSAESDRNPKAAELFSLYRKVWIEFFTLWLHFSSPSYAHCPKCVISPLAQDLPEVL